MAVEIFNIAQGSAEWFECRRGIPTASKFQCLLADSKDRVGRTSYLRQLAGERITGEPAETYKNDNMARGNAMEEEARNYYALMTGAEPQLVGFMRNGAKGASPDSLIGNDGMVEIKTQIPALLIATIEKDEFPNVHKAQTQGGLWVAEREWIDLIIYWPRMPTFIKRAYRDIAYIATLARAVAEFNEDLEALVDRIKRYGST